jgi:hypothetical protein
MPWLRKIFISEQNLAGMAYFYICIPASPVKTLIYEIPNYSASYPCINLSTLYPKSYQHEQTSFQGLIFSITLLTIFTMNAGSQPVKNYEKEWKKVDDFVKSSFQNLH